MTYPNEVIERSVKDIPGMVSCKVMSVQHLGSEGEISYVLYLSLGFEGDAGLQQSAAQVALAHDPTGLVTAVYVNMKR